MGCCDNPDIRKGNAWYVCIKCGQTSGQLFYQIDNFKHNISRIKKKSTDSRTRWFRNLLMEYVRDNTDRERINGDFQTPARCYEKHNLLEGRNMSIYGYYISALSRRRGVPLLKEPRGVKTTSKKALFDERYQRACKILGW